MTLKYETFVTTKADVKAMVKALNANAKKPEHKVQKDEVGYWLQLTKGKFKGKDVFRAMVGSNKTYLVRHVTDLFV
tara:strand:- start:663 stop:890 length:228 start_codon:yes stop_codon:yes gene_type:complete